MQISARNALAAAALAAVAAGAFAQPTLYGISYAAEFLAGVLANPGTPTSRQWPPAAGWMQS